MARDISAKIADGGSLDDDDIQYAVSRGIALPDQYSGAAEQATAQMASDGDTGRVAPAAPVDGLVLDSDMLMTLDKPTLNKIGVAADLDVEGMVKADMVAILTGQMPSGDDGDGDDDDTESGQ